VSILKKNYTVLLALFVLGLMTFMLSKESFAKAAITTASPSGIQIKNQNQVNTQNMGEEQNLEVSTQEQEGTKSGNGVGLENKNPNAVEHMSIVAKSVQELLQVRTKGGIGDQVREIAREQNQAQDQIQIRLGEIEAKGNLVKFLFGPDYKAIKSLKQLLEQNLLRVESLEQLMTQVTNEADQTVIQETITALTQENTSLQEAISAQEDAKSLFGWLAKLFVK
jgi:putative cell wall-binding protein